MIEIKKKYIRDVLGVGAGRHRQRWPALIFRIHGRQEEVVQNIWKQHISKGDSLTCIAFEKLCKPFKAPLKGYVSKEGYRNCESTFDLFCLVTDMNFRGETLRDLGDP